MNIEDLYNRALAFGFEPGSMIDDVWFYEKDGMTLNLAKYMENHKEETEVEIPEGTFGVYMGDFTGNSLFSHLNYTFIFPKSCKYVCSELYTNNAGVLGTYNSMLGKSICEITLFKNSTFDYRKCESVESISKFCFYKSVIDRVLFGKIAKIDSRAFANCKINRLEFDEVNRISGLAFSDCEIGEVFVYSGSLHMKANAFSSNIKKIVLNPLIISDNCVFKSSVDELYIHCDVEGKVEDTKGKLDKMFKELNNLSCDDPYAKYIKIAELIEKFASLNDTPEESGNFMSDVFYDLSIYKMCSRQEKNINIIYNLMDSLDSLFLDSMHNSNNRIYLYMTGSREPWKLCYDRVESYSDYKNIVYVERV